MRMKKTLFLKGQSEHDSRSSEGFTDSFGKKKRRRLQGKRKKSKKAVHVIIEEKITMQPSEYICVAIFLLSSWGKLNLNFIQLLYY